MRLSGSRYGLLRCCAWWARPEVQVESVASDLTDAGTHKHAVLEAIHNDRPLRDYAAVWGCEEQEWPGVISNISEWLPLDGQAEIQVYYDPATDTARDVVGAEHRDYDCRPGEIPMTLDLMRSGEVWDYKTGWQAGIDSAEDHGQLALCSLAVARLLGVDSITGVLAMVRDDGTAYLDRTEYDSLDLEALVCEMRTLLAAVPTSEPHPGPWCGSKWCPARSVCPATQQSIVSTPLAPLSLTIDSPEVCAKVHTQIALAEEFLAAVKRARNTWLEEHPSGCELADGSHLEIGVEERDTIEVSPAALTVLEEHGCSNAVEPKTSKAAIERVIRSTAVKGEFAPKMRAVLEALDAEHCIKTSQFTKIKVRKGRKVA